MSIVDLKYDYQKEMYAEIKSLIDSGETSLCYALCMGLGKTYIFLKILEDYFIGKQVLYVSPTRAINSSLETKAEFIELQKLIQIDRITFTMFNKERPDYIDYDGLFIDEIHHGVSPIQGKNLMNLKNQMVEAGKLVVGFSATPIFKSIYTREFVDIRDMFNQSVTGLSIAEAIRTGVLPKIKYAIAVPNILKLMEDTGHSPDEFRLKYSVDSTKSMLENIVSENSEIRHWIAFFSSGKTLKEGVEQLKSLFPEYTIYTLYSEMEEDSKDVLYKFDTDPGRCILASINMLLEGVHARTCEGILLYRKPGEMVFTQIMGRMMDINYGNRQPVFVDVMNIGSKLQLSQYLEYTTEFSYKVSGTGNPRTKSIETLKDVIDVNCQSYRYVQMLEDILGKQQSVVVNGVEIVYTSYTDLLRQLGMTDKNAKDKVERKLNAGWSLEDVCLHYLEVASYQHEKTDIVDGKEVKWYTPTDLINAFDTIFHIKPTITTILKYLRQGWTPDEIYHKLIDNTGSVVVNGETIKYTSYADLSRKLGEYDGFVGHWIREGKTLDEIVAKVTGGDATVICIDGKIYKFKSDRDLARLLHVNYSTIAKWKRRGLNYEEIIRRLVPYEVIIDGKPFQFKQYTELSIKLGMGPKYVLYERQHHPERTLQQIADIAIGRQKNRSMKTIIVDGKEYKFQTDSQLCSLLGESDHYVGHLRRNYELSYEEIIQRSLQKRANRQELTVNGRYFEWGSDRELSQKLGRYDKYVRAYRLQGMSYEDIIKKSLKYDGEYDGPDLI